MTTAIENNLTGKLANGAVWTLLMRWTVRALGFISMLILARLLTPDDFGLVAMATVVSGLASVLFEFGVATVLIQDPNPGRREYDTAWTVRLLQAGLASLVMVLAAPYAIGYFGEPRIDDVLYWIALATALGGLENIGVVQFQKQLDFKRDFQFEVSRKFIQFVVTLSMALLLRSYWALVLGILVGRLSGVVVSYIIHPYRPRLDLGAFSKIWSFSRWILALRIGAYVRNEVDKIVIGGRNETSTVGHYFLASEIANMVTTEILAPINRAVFPVLSKLQQCSETRGKALHLALASQATVTFPLTIGLAIVSDDLVHLLLGNQWVSMVPVLGILAWIGIPLCIRYTFSSALTAVRKLRVITFIVWIEIAMFLLLVAMFPSAPSVFDIACIKIGLSMIVSVMLLIYAASLGLTCFSSLVTALWRPTSAVIGMAAALLLLQPILTGIHGLDLFVQVAFGGGVYVSLIMISWLLIGRPEGFESLVLQRLGWLN